MKTGNNKIGWTIPKKGERSIRDVEHGLFGQEIWYALQKQNFVHPEPSILNPRKKYHDWEEKLKNWLIWGYW